MLEIALRNATIADAEMILSWRNAKEVRLNSFTSHEISKDDHLLWFTQSLKNKNRHLLIAELAHDPVGVLRFDIIDNIASIDIYLKPLMSGRGIGTAILQMGSHWLKTHIPQVNTIHAKILPHNKASQRAFEKANFQLNHLAYEIQI